jgi:signal transduction histidine kinase
MHIVADLKRFARHDDGGLNEEVDLNAVVHACLRLVHNQVKRHARVSVELASDLPRVKGNSQRLEQVLVNLLINAAQAVEEKAAGGAPDPSDLLGGASDASDPSAASGAERAGPGSIRVRTLLRGDGRVALVVRDDGAGMTTEVRRRLFDPFFTTKRNRHGTGLGLSVSYGIVSEHGGAIEVDSAPGGGAEFRVLLPAMAAAPSAPAGPGGGAPGRASGSGGG